MTEEEKENWESCKCRMKQEGFDYCFMHYSNWEEIKDKEFHRLRINYIEAAKKLRQYINDKVDNLE